MCCPVYVKPGTGPLSDPHKYLFQIKYLSLASLASERFFLHSNDYEVMRVSD